VFLLGLLLLGSLGQLAPRLVPVLVPAGAVLLIILQYVAGALARRESPARMIYAALAAADLFVLQLISLAWIALAGPEGSRYLVPWLVAASVGGGMIIKLARGTPWPEWLLPLQGIYARRLLAALGIALLVGASPLGFLIGAALRVPVGGALLLTWLLVAGLPCYFAPLWHTLVTDPMQP